MIKILLSDLKARSSDRPLGYYEEILKKGKIEMAEILVMRESDYAEFRKKYNPTTQQIPVSVVPQPIPRKDWPIWVKGLAMIAKPEDKGIGDVVARTIGAENSEAFKKWFKATTGKDCGCTGRHRRLNIEYPLP